MKVVRIKSGIDLFASDLDLLNTLDPNWQDWPVDRILYELGLVLDAEPEGEQTE